tara:strand:- start:2552 stop:3274 length:723 start_codon:yes stop_codon:yes gene_type:complete
MPIYHNLKTIQVRIPKTGSTSMANALTKLNGSIGIRHTGPNKIHSSIHQIKGIQGFDEFDSYFKFAFVRNPFDWLISNCMYFKGPYGQARRISIEDWILGLERVMESRGGDYFNFNPYSYAFSNSKTASCGHGRCQAIGGRRECNCLSSGQLDYISDGSKILVDYVGKLENIENDWMCVLDKAGIKEAVALPHDNKKEHSKDSYVSMFKDERVVEIVYKLFKNECEMFGYHIDDYPGFKI